MGNYHLWYPLSRQGKRRREAYQVGGKREKEKEQGETGDPCSRVVAKPKGVG